MSKLAIHSSQLETLENSLKEALKKTNLLSISLQVDCSLSEDTLIITLSETEANPYDPQTILQVLKYTIKRQTSFENYPIQVYFSDHKTLYNLQEMVTIPLNELKGTSLNVPKLLELFSTKSRATFETLDVKTISKNHNIATPKNLKFFFLITGISVSVIIGGIYTLTRPCVIDKCQIIKEVKQQVDKSIIVLDKSPSESDILNIKQALKESINRLQSIPWWSSYYSEAKKQKQNYQQDLKHLSILISFENIQNQVNSLIKNNSSSLFERKAAQETLSQSLLDLETISDSSIFSDWGAKQVEKNQILMNRLQQKLANEDKAKISLNLARKAAKIAEKRENKAKNLSDLELIISTWKTAVKRLQEISPETTLYKPSRQLLKTYLAKINQVENRKNQEELAVKIYEQAKKQAKLGEEAASKNQWSQSVTYWTQAINYIKQVPQNTFQFSQSQPLISSYTLSLNKAKSQLKQAIELENIRRDLKEICTDSNQVCIYTIDGSIIKIKLNSDYIEKVWNTALQAKVHGDLQTQTQLLHHLSSFEHRLQGISDRSGKTIEVYNAQRNLMAVYQKRQ